MLKDNKGQKPYEIEITQEKWSEAKLIIIEGIRKKLEAAKKLIKSDKVAAGLYIYAVEEFGKLLLLDNLRTD